MKAYFILYSCCLIVDGISRSIICDLQRRRYKPIPHLLSDLLRQMKREQLSLEELKMAYQHKYDQGLDLFLKSLREEDYGLYVSNPNNFPDLDLTHLNHATISNAILDFNHDSNYDWSKIAVTLGDLGCEAVELRFFDLKGFNRNIDILKTFNNTCIQGIEILKPFVMKHYIKRF